MALREQVGKPESDAGGVSINSEMVMSQNSGTPIWIPIYYIPYYGAPPKGTCNFGKLLNGLPDIDFYVFVSFPSQKRATDFCLYKSHVCLCPTRPVYRAETGPYRATLAMGQLGWVAVRERNLR